MVWDDKYFLGDQDGKVEIRDQLRPCQSVRETSTTAAAALSNNMAPLTTFPRSLSTPAANNTSKVFGPLDVSGKPPPAGRKLFSLRKLIN